ncbi:MAG: DUF5615 family PIN-like protein [Ktedonobacteraceae bacterium]|nr:DUF5615 family PIN-like protein [Ktedonobacteraceae bacterium]MBA3823750.1 DUF5615 family PIN-like protein [Ktedonobacterales bacterium]
MAALYVDEGISRQLVIDLVAQGFVIVHALDLGPKGRHDTVLFREAQQRQTTIFTLNRADFLFLATAWQEWGLGNYFGIITPKPGKQPTPIVIAQTLLQYCRDTSSFINRIELF